MGQGKTTTTTMNRRRMSIVSAHPGNDPCLKLVANRFDRLCREFEELNSLIQRATRLMRENNGSTEGLGILAQYIRKYTATISPDQTC